MKARNSRGDAPPSDWRAATWEGATREAMRRWAALPLERILAAQEEMADLAAALAGEPAGDPSHGDPESGPD